MLKQNIVSIRVHLTTAQYAAFINAANEYNARRRGGAITAEECARVFLTGFVEEYSEVTGLNRRRSGK